MIQEIEFLERNPTLYYIGQETVLNVYATSDSRVLPCQHCARPAGDVLRKGERVGEHVVANLVSANRTSSEGRRLPGKEANETIN